MAAERLVRGPVHREDGQAKTFVKICSIIMYLRSEHQNLHRYHYLGKGGGITDLPESF